MDMILKFAFRNVLRSRKRSFLTVITIFFAATLVGVAQSWVNGIMNLYIENFARYQTGHIRITTEEFKKREKFMPVDEIVPDVRKLIHAIKKINGVKTVEEKIRFGILLGNDGTTVQATGAGIDLENNSLDLRHKLVQGKIQKSGIYIGHELAEKLGVVQGGKLLLAAKTSEGGLNGIKLRVEGIYRFNMFYDKKYFFIGLDDAKKLLKIHGGATELFIYTDDISDSDAIKQKIVSILPAGLKAETWKEQLGDFYSVLESSRTFYAFIEIIILFLASFVIINTMMMAIFERLREIGTMKAMGMTDRELFLNFTCEGAILGITGGVAGAVTGFILITIVSAYGVDLSSQVSGIEMPFEYIVRPIITIRELFIALIISITVPTVAAMIPARYVRKLMPAEALRK